MKKRIMTVVAALTLGAILVLSGCASTPSGTERSQSASGTMEIVENDIRLVVISINSANQNLAALINPRQEHSVKALVTYASSVDALVRSNNAYTEHADRMGVEGRD